MKSGSKTTNNIANRAAGMGNRLPQAMKARLKAMLDTGVAVPSLSHYVT